MGSLLIFSHRLWRRGLSSLNKYILIQLILVALCISTAVSERQAYRTAYGCEGATLSITCEPGHVINVIRANYGRFSITICNNHGNTDWSVNCKSPHTHRVLADRCSGSNGCLLDVSSTLFGDPCPGTFKYIEVHYSCGLATTTTTTGRPRPPWFIHAKEPVWVPNERMNFSSSPDNAISPLLPLDPSQETKSSTILPPPPFIASTTAKPTTTTSTTTTKKSTTTTSPTPSTTTSAKPVFVLTTSSSPPTVITTHSFHEPDDFASNDLDEQSVINSDVFVQHPTQRSIPSTSSSWKGFVKSVPVTVSPFYGSQVDSDSPWCAPTFARGLNWNWTRSGDTAVLTCPGGATGTAKRKCSLGKWEEKADLSECRSAWLTALNKRSNTQDSVLAVATDLSKVTSSKSLYGGDLITAARLIKSLSRRMMQDVASAFPEPQQRRALVTEFLLSSLETGSALLSAGLVGPWGDLSPMERRYAVTELMIGLEEAAFLLGDVLPRSTQTTHFRSHILISVRAVATDGSYVNFPSKEDDDINWVFTDLIVLPPEAILENSEGSSTQVVFLAYRHLEDLLSLEKNSFSGSKRPNSPLIVNSRIISASLGHGRHIQLPEPVTLTFSLLKQDNVSNPICVFWDYTTYSWSDEGCLVHSYNKTHVTCKCDHLTNFAVIMEEFSGEQIVEEGVSALSILAYVGCFLSILAAAGYIIVFTLFKNDSSCRVRIRCHICACICVTELVFLIGAWRTDLPILCGITAGILHYTVLVSLAWMCLEGFQIFLAVTKPTDNEEAFLRWWHILACYGVPLLIVASSAIVDPFSFGTADYCWLRAENYFVFSLFGPAMFIVALELAFLAAAVVRTCRFHSDEDLKAKEMAKMASSRSWLRSAVVLLSLFSLNWILGFLLLSQPSLPAAVGFFLLNVSHGAFVFIDQWVRNHKFLPSPFHTGTGWKTHQRHHPMESPYREGGTLIMASRGSLRQPGPPLPYPIPMGSLHQSLPRGRLPPSSHAVALLQGGATPLTAPDEAASYKSSRDSGHGGSEQEDSPRPQWLGVRGAAPPYATSLRGIPGVPTSCSLSPWSHTYMEIEVDRDPVYEEVGRGGPPSDASRQSSRSYGDARPLLASRGTPSRRAFQEGRSDLPFALNEDRLRDFDNAQATHDLEQQLRLVQSTHSGAGDMMALAVLDGEQVVCCLEPSAQHLQECGGTPYGGQTLPIIHEGTQGRRGYPGRIVISPSRQNN